MVRQEVQRPLSERLLHTLANSVKWKIIPKSINFNRKTTFGPIHTYEPFQHSHHPIFYQHSLFVFVGREKDAWPELLNSKIHDAVSTLNKSGLVKNVHIQSPSAGTPPSTHVQGSKADVWLYTDGNIVTEIPRRGEWHPNRNTL